MITAPPYTIPIIVLLLYIYYLYRYLLPSNYVQMLLLQNEILLLRYCYMIYVACVMSFKIVLWDTECTFLNATTT